MKTIKHPEDKLQPALFADEDLGWWAMRLSPKALRKLEGGWQGMFRRSALKLMPAQKLGEHFSAHTGRPTKELYSMAGLMLIADFKNLTGEQAAQAYTFDASVQYALNLPRDGQYLSARSVDNYRRLFREDEHAQQVFSEVSAALVKELELNIKVQRLDSTHVLSNMAKLGRQQMLATSVRRFLVVMQKQHAPEHGRLDGELRGRYEAAESRLFGQGTKNPLPREEALQQIGADMSALIVSFARHEAISKEPAYVAVARLFAEHFERSEQPPGTIKLRRKSQDAQGGSIHTLQNTSDVGAGYSGHKGSGYQAQIAQALPPRDGKGNIEGPGLITALVPQSASVRDSEALMEVLDHLEQSGLKALEMSADTIYGSDANVQSSARRGVEIISPVGGGAPCKDEPTHRPSRKEREAKERLVLRRKEETGEAWRKRYSVRSGIEGLHHALDLVTGFKRLRVRGLKAVSMALLLKAAGWNIMAAAQIRARRQRQARAKAPAFIMTALAWALERLTRLIRTVSKWHPAHASSYLIAPC